MPKKPIDTQHIELLGRGILVEQMMRAGLEVAEPLRDRGVDLGAYADLAGDVQRFVARPIQMKAASHSGFSLDRKYERIADLLIAFVWHIDSPEQACVYAMSYPEAVEIGDQLGYTRTPSWAKGKYANSRPGKNLRELLEPLRMTPERWRDRVIGDLSV